MKDNQEVSPEDGLMKAISYYEEMESLSSWWDMIALSAAGEMEWEKWQLPEWSEADLPYGSAATDYAGIILGLVARGDSPHDWYGRNLTAELAGLQQEDGSFGTSINQSIWAAIALEITDTAYGQEVFLSHLREQQQEYGGFALAGQESDADMTAMVLMALSLSKGSHETETIIENALAFLEQAKLPSGGYASFGRENANSTAVVVSALKAVGEDLASGCFGGKEGPLQALLSFQLANGSFSFYREPFKTDNMATCQALIALGDVYYGKSVFLRLHEKYALLSEGGERQD